MSKASEAANAMMYAVDQCCGLYGVYVTRMQSRTFMVEGVAGRWRPMFVGRWIDQYGKPHNSGMADLLARPRVPAHFLCEQAITCPIPNVCREPFVPLVTIPLWIECKSGTKARMEHDQIAFKNYVEANGETYLLLHDEVEPLLEWFKTHGVEKRFDSVIPATPGAGLPVANLDAIPCRHCEQKRSEHSGKILACRIGAAQRVGKVWSPQLRREIGK